MWSYPEGYRVEINMTFEVLIVQVVSDGINHLFILSISSVKIIKLLLL